MTSCNLKLYTSKYASKMKVKAFNATKSEWISWPALKERINWILSADKKWKQKKGKSKFGDEYKLIWTVQNGNCKICEV